MFKNQPIKFKPDSWFTLTPWFIMLVVLWTTINTTFKKDYKTGIIESDAKGYYAYLPAVFIYHDLNFRFFYKIERVDYYTPTLYYQFLRVENSKTINKYYAGTALCLAPFFLAGHVLTLVEGYPADGYSYYYTMMTHFGALFYLLLAMLGLRKLLRSYAVGEMEISISLLAIVFGTNLFYYVVTEFAMSHVYSFAAIVWFCYSVRKYLADFKGKYLIYCALLLGIIALIRPVNLLVVLAIPFLAGNPKLLFDGFKNLLKNHWALLIGILSFVFLVSIQFLIYKQSTGNFLVYSYQEEGFNFLNPQLSNFLFSYRKGMFLYTPMLFISLLGFVYLVRESRFQFFALTGFLFILVYVFSSWHMWFYGGSFSQRPMIEFYAFFAIPLGIALQKLKNTTMRKLFIGSIFLLIIVCQVQTYQYRRAHIHWSDMTKGKYWDVFMRVDRL